MFEKVFAFKLKAMKNEIKGCTFLAPYKTSAGELKVRATFKNGNKVAITVGEINSLTNADYEEIKSILLNNA